ncbi:MAG: hypothetical protein RL202_143, partial [Actinomycetota bacterium]
GFCCAASFDHRENRHLLSGKTLPAGSALAATADRAALVDRTGIDDSAISLTAVGTVHPGHPLETVKS